jgi:2-dehydro-3-deoxyphosphogluconate aldolase/(4S)-4-hydroxy-2-oxoglutarate aldolase
MQNNKDVIESIIDTGVVAIIRTGTAEEAVKTADALVEGGITALEVTYSVPGATEVIRELGQRYSGRNLYIGAGTVLDPETARSAILAGAEYIIAPNFDKATAELCNRYQIPYIPGCFTVTEIARALEAGCRLIKLFPASAFTPDIIKAICAPLPQVRLVPTGGVGLDNAFQWIKAGAAALGVGGSLTRVTGGRYDQVSENCRKLIRQVREARNNKQEIKNS